MLLLLALLLIVIFVLATMRPRRADPVGMGRMSEQWLAEHRATHTNILS